MEKRISIIDSYRQGRPQAEGSIEKRLKKARMLSNLQIIIGGLCVFLLFVSIISTSLNLPFSLNWDKAALTVIITLSMALNFQPHYFEIKLLRHQKKLNACKASSVPDELNAELTKLTEKINNRFRKYWPLILPVLVILAAALWQIFSNYHNPYWSYFKIPVLLVFVFIFWDFFQINARLSNNLNKAEEYLKS
jgi:hypothetical protein